METKSVCSRQWAGDNMAEGKTHMNHYSAQGLQKTPSPPHIDSRYARNPKAIPPDKQKKLRDSAVLILGAGGLGGNILEILARTGVGRLTVADGDHFEASNLNRQTLCTENNLGENKARAAAERAVRINSLIRAEPMPCFLKGEKLDEALNGQQIVVDALGGIEAKKMLLNHCRSSKLPLVSGFIAGWTGLVCTVLPDETGPLSFWQGSEDGAAEKTMGCIAPVTGLVAAIQSSEVLHILFGDGPKLSGGVLCTDLWEGTFDFLETGD